MVSVLPFGETALLLEPGSLEHVLALHARLAAHPPPGVIDLVPAARTLLVHVDPRTLPLSAARAWIERSAADAEASPVVPGAVVELDIVYDGADLASTAALLGLTADELAARHAGAEWTVAFTGFAPGFGYLTSPQWPFDVPRLDTPRTRVPAGAVGVASGFTGAYPRSSPGGWRLIGTTAAVLFDPRAAAPTLLPPGTRVRFRPGPPLLRPHQEVGDAILRRPQIFVEPSQESVAEAVRAGVAGTGRGMPGAFRILEPGPLCTVQDLGRPGHLAEGIAASGAADRGALRTAHRLVGNAEHAAGLELTMGGLCAVALSDLWFAVTGAWGAVTVAGRSVDTYRAQPWPAGTELCVAAPDHGVRSYLAVRGGIDAPGVLGSRAADTLGGLGPAPLRAGDECTVTTDLAGPIPADDLHPWSPGAPDDLELELAAGPRADWFAPEALHALFDATWTVSARTDRVGTRLDGPDLARVHAGELPSEAMLPGAVQVPPGGPVILGRDAPATGGYPVIAVATDASLDLLAQARPGTRIRFRHARRRS